MCDLMQAVEVVPGVPGDHGQHVVGLVMEELGLEHAIALEHSTVRGPTSRSSSVTHDPA